MSADGKAVYWVSFLDGLQRVLLFTEDFKLAYKASQVSYAASFNVSHFVTDSYSSFISLAFLPMVVLL